MSAGIPFDQEDPTALRSDNVSPADEANMGLDQTVAIAVTFEGSSAEPSVATADQLADNDVLAVMTTVTPDVLTHLEHTFDQLISATDLFDVPSIDFDGAGSS